MENLDPNVDMDASNTRRSFTFQFTKKHKLAPEFIYVFKYVEPISSTLKEMIVDTSHLILSEVKVGTTNFAVSGHWAARTVDEQEAVMAEARRYVYNGLARIRGKMFTWREVFEAKKATAHISNINRLAFDAGYEYFLFSDVIYKALSKGDWDITGFTREHIL